MEVFVHHPGWLQAQLGQMLWTMQQKATLCDVTIHPADNAPQIKAHSAVLAAASPHLQKLFQSLKEGYYTLRTSNISRHIWLYLIEFVYQGGVMVKDEHVSDVRRIARKLDIKLEPSTGMSPCEESKGFSSQGGVIVIEDDDLAGGKKEEDKEGKEGGGGEKGGKEQQQQGNGPVADVILSSMQTGTTATSAAATAAAVAAAASAVDSILAQKPTVVTSSAIHENSGSVNADVVASVVAADCGGDKDLVNNEHNEQIATVMPTSADDDEDDLDEDDEGSNNAIDGISDANGEDSSSFIPSIKQVIKEAVSRRKKSIPRKVIKDTVVATTNMYSITGDKLHTARPQIAEVMPTTRQNMDLPLSQSPSSTVDLLQPDAKRLKLHSDGLLAESENPLLAGGVGGILASHNNTPQVSAPSSIINIVPEVPTSNSAPIPGLPTLPGQQAAVVGAGNPSVSLPAVSLPDLSSMQGLMTAAPFLNLNPTQLFPNLPTAAGLQGLPNLQNLQLDAATAQLLTAQLQLSAAAGNPAAGQPGMVYLPTQGLPGHGAGGLQVPGLGGQSAAGLGGLAGLGGQGNWGGSVGNQGALAGGEKGTVDPGMFSVDDPPEDYNDFIQWVKAVRAKLRVSQTALSDALNNTPQLTKRYSQTIVSSFETFKMSRKEVAFLRPFIINILQNVATKLGIKNA